MRKKVSVYLYSEIHVTETLKCIITGMVSYVTYRLLLIHGTYPAKTSCSLWRFYDIVTFLPLAYRQLDCKHSRKMY